MAEIRFKTEWLTQIALLAACGTAEDVADLCAAIQRAAQDLPVNEMSSLTETLFHPIAEDIEASRELSRVRSEARKGNKTATKSDKTATKINKISQEKEEEREEDGEAERENDKEEIPHTPLEEKDKEKGEEGEEEKEEEREIISRPLRAEVCEIALPEPQFIAETDPKKLTERMLEEEFDALWLLYPRKDGRKDALRHYKAARREGVTFDEVESGIKRYANYVRDKDPTYTAMGSTWFCGHRWEDRIENHGPRPGSMAWLANIANGGALDDS